MIGGAWLFRIVVALCYTYLIHTGKITVEDTWAVPIILLLTI